MSEGVLVLLQGDEVHEEPFVHVVVQEFVLKGSHAHTLQFTSAHSRCVIVLRVRRGDFLNAIHQLSKRVEIFGVSFQCRVKVFLKRYR